MSKFHPRAAVAYINVEKRAGRVADQPSEAHSFERSLVEKDYMVLRNASRLLAVYRIRRDNEKLKRLNRWPTLIGDAR
ncbi:hypothetical protein B0G80_4392 [Paraburkholderia sp. BL6669N2]|uniref:hypothetical protein n=1 Tax=Paraburkholderia sp. BL6669N2 TaxID=1938807 RepID=UPI000E2433AC|nr:hypothetical protein [Paraburkholderia sp. BL6669N2]REG61539.1 hypothetical protein B0G80_4392 [Paraburkholderia sp. BL6669N2]